LENICHWLTVMAPGQTIELADLPPEMREAHGESGGTVTGTGGGSGGDWTADLARELALRLAAGEVGLIDELTRRFEETCIKVGLAHTGGRKVEAAHLLGWGRNTLTRKIHELGLEEAHEEI
jgi:two-component system nitrogen regulation response regulator GlnG